MKYTKKSIWEKEISKPHFPSLNGDMKTDVLVIGGGITGLLCGYMLAEAGVDCCIVEARRICDGVTKNTSAKVTYHHGAIFDKMIRTYGMDKAHLYIQAHSEALEKYKALAKEIPCDFKEATSYVYSMDNKKKIQKEVEALRALGCPATFTEQTELPFSVVGAVAVEGQAQFNPLKFLYAIAERLNIYENTEVTELTPEGAVTKKGRIRAKRIIVATHFPFINKHGLYFMKMYQHRSYVLALEGAPLFEGMYVDESEKGLSFRSHDKYLLLGGGGHRTGKDGGGWNELSAFAKKRFPHAKEVCRFATQDCITLDSIPYIGHYGASTPTLYAATGFNKWGMTSSMAAASVLTDMVCGRENKYCEIFSPQRRIMHKQLLVNAGESILGLITPKAPRCSHLGCALKYNKQEHTWDCGCHGSRFTDDGRVIDNPATEDITIK